MADEKTFTQEELEGKIKERLERASKKHADEIAAKDEEIKQLKKASEELKNQYAHYEEDKAKTETEIEDLKSKIKGYETASAKRKIADTLGLDSKAIEFISGETEEEMTASAEKLKALTGNYVPPFASTEKEPENKIDQAFNELNSKIKGNN